MKSSRVSNQMKATEQCFSCGTVLFFFNRIRWLKLIRLWIRILRYDHSSEKATGQEFPVAIFIILYKLILTCESVDKTPELQTFK